MMDNALGPENAQEAADRRLREAVELRDKPKVEALKAELIALQKALDPTQVYGKTSFVQQFEGALERARRFAELMFPSDPLP